jgi:hypothetical protein
LTSLPSTAIEPGEAVSDAACSSPATNGTFSLAAGALERLRKRLENSPAVSSDPYDVKAHPWFVRRIAQRDQLVSAVLLKAGYAASAFFPYATRRMLGIKSQQTAGAIAWLAQAYIELFRLNGAYADKQAAKAHLDVLEKLQSPGSSIPAWGLPFDWQSLVLLPANCPLVYPTWQAAQAYLEFYQISGEDRALEVCLRACYGLTSVFNKVVDNPQHLCLSYSPHDRMEVYNINALAGGLCCKTGKAAGDGGMVRSGTRMLNWVLDGQQEDGSWTYFSNGFKGGNVWIDHFHTAMTLQGLMDGWEVCRDQQLQVAVDAGLQFYLDTMFDSQDRPKYFPTSTFPIDVMSCAEGILFLARAQNSACIRSNLRRKSADRLQKLVRWTCENLQSHDGQFYYRKYRLFRLSLWSHRWGQGAMLKALAAFLSAKQ